MPRTPTTGQKISSKIRNTLRDAIIKLRRAKAPTAMSSTRQLNEHVLEIGLPDLDVAHHDAFGVQRVQDLRQPFLRVVHGAFQTSIVRHAAQDRSEEHTSELQ